MRGRAAAAAAYLGALYLHGYAGPATPGVRSLVVIAALLFVALCCGRREPALRQLTRTAALLALAAALVLLPATTPRSLLYALAVGVAGAETLAGAGAALILVGVASAASPWFPGVAAQGGELASFLGNAFAPDGGAAQRFGPSAAAVPAALVALAMLAGRAARCRAGVFPWLGMAAVVAAACGQWWIAGEWLSRFGAHAGHVHAVERQVFDTVPVAVALYAAAVVLGWGGRPREIEEAEGAEAVKAAAAGLVAGAALALLWSGWRLPQAEDKRLAFLNAGGLDWERPTFDRLGAFSSGMFGLWPLYLRDAGWEAKVVSWEEMAEFGRDDAQVLVLLNCHLEWSAEQRRRLEEFVSAGGSILVLGDHTDVFGLRKGFNTLLGPWGIEFRFDSAYHAGGGFDDDLEWKPGLLGMGWDPRSAGIGIGASLAVRAPAQPLVQARYAFSDEGIRENLMGSFLGDYHYERGEILGDLAVVAGLRLGKGRVVVYGDTSGFQNGGLSLFFAPHVAPLLRALARPAGFSVPRGLEEVLAAAAVLAALWRLLVPARRAAFFWGAVALSVAAAAAADPPPRAAAELRGAELAQALVLDESHFPEIGHYEAGWNVAGALDTSAQRSGLRAYHLKDWDPEVLSRARVLALIAPRRAFRAAELEQIDAEMRRGATVIAAATGVHGAALRPLLQRYGVELAAYSFGPVPAEGRQEELEPRCVDASPLRLAPGAAAAEELYRYGDNLLAAAVPVGAGWLLVFGDTRFFSIGNVEGVWGWWSGNINFLEELFRKYCGGDAAAVAEIFPLPLPPEEGT